MISYILHMEKIILLLTRIVELGIVVITFIKIIIDKKEKIQDQIIIINKNYVKNNIIDIKNYFQMSGICISGCITNNGYIHQEYIKK